MSEMVEKGRKWIVELIRSGAPVIICLIGGLMLTVSEKVGWASIFVATVFWVLALDLAATRAAAKAKEDTAAKFINAITSGHDTTITVEVIKRHTALEDHQHV